MLLKRLESEFVACSRRYNLPIGDFPDVKLYRKILSETKDIGAFKKLDKNLVYEMDKVMTVDIPILLQKVLIITTFYAYCDNFYSIVSIARQQDHLTSILTPKKVWKILSTKAIINKIITVKRMYSTIISNHRNIKMTNIIINSKITEIKIIHRTMFTGDCS